MIKVEDRNIQPLDQNSTRRGGNEVEDAVSASHEFQQKNHEQNTDFSVYIEGVSGSTNFFIPSSFNPLVDDSR